MTRRGPRTKIRSALIADELRRMIRSGELAPGTRLRQDHLAAQFGVSSTPVREALAVLTRERLVHHDAHRGAIVFPPTAADVRENFEIRLALEPLATELAAARFDAAAADHLRQLLSDVDAAVERTRGGGDPDSYERADRAFHQAIFAAAGRPQLLEMIESLRDAAAAYAHLHLAGGIDPALLGRLHAHHPALIDALTEHDGERARQIAADHVWLTAEGSGAAIR